ncbi:MAG: restriction endonuclease subunit S [Deltaproteobacteria bacterium]|nr:restriction endonuclease subunit S [Deltaproteobacteria bacterium]
MQPDEWRARKLKQVLTLQRGFDLPRSQRTDGNVPVISSGGQTGWHKEAKVSSPGVVTGRYGSVGEVYYVSEDFWPLNTTLFVSDFRGNYPKYIFYLLKSLDFRRFSDKTGVPGVNRNDLHLIRVSHPPLPEQKEIAEILSTWDEAIDQTRRLIDAKMRRKKALMQQLLTGKKRLPGFDRPWEECKLSQLLQPRNTCSEITTNLPLYSLTIENGITPKTDRYDRQALVKNKETKQYKKVYPNDIVFNPSNLRWGAIARSKVGFEVLVSPIYEVLSVSHASRCHPVFLSELLCSENQIRMFAARVEGTLVERMAVKLNVFLTTRVTIPADFVEQKKIARVLSSADKEIRVLIERLTALEKQKRGLMQKLLTGEVRVKT